MSLSSMRLDQALVARGLCESRTEAQELIEAGQVSVNGSVVMKQTKSVEESDSIVVLSRRKYVSRGGEKLEGVLFDVYKNEEAIRSALLGKDALDIGSSTGGFTDCLLRYGVGHIDAVDVGTGQLHQSLRTQKRVSVYEQTDIRTFAPGKTYDVIVADLSFIPLEHVFDACINFGSAGTEYFLLIKPQFEVGKGNTKKGIVKDADLVAFTLERYKQRAMDAGLDDVSIYLCRIRGGDGNQEYFLYGKVR